MRQFLFFAAVLSLLVSCGSNTKHASMDNTQTREIKPTEIPGNPIQLFDEQWALVTAGVPGDVQVYRAM